MAVHQALLSEGVADLSRDLTIVFVVADFNKEVTDALLQKNKERLEKEGFECIDVVYVPGAFEIPAMTMQVIDGYDLVICIGCVIKGQTPHFDYICQECARGLMDVSLASSTPLVFGVLTCDSLEQAEKRIDDNYAVYGLNYLETAQTFLEEEAFLSDEEDEESMETSSVSADLMEKMREYASSIVEGSN